MTAVPSTFTGPQCPHCQVPLTQDWVRTGTILCPYCSRGFDATVFQPVQRKTRIVEVATAGPEGANACANHPRNAAVTSCQRCGLLICSLCDMNIGEGSQCPSCFDRVRSEGTLRAAVTRYRDYTALGRLSLLGGFLLTIMFLTIPLGALAVFYGWKGTRQRRAEGSSALGPWIVIILGLLEVLGGLSFIGFLIWSVTNTSK